jgi:hypothetical protein
LFRTRRELLLENLGLRQQLMVLKRKHPRPRLAAFDKLFWAGVSPPFCVEELCQFRVDERPKIGN